MMTDKQIIIDGVDVSECRCLAYPELDNPMCNGLYLGCKNNNCEYKKWKRKEQECERLESYNNFDVSSLQETNKALLREIAFLNERLDKLKAEHKQTQKALAKAWIDNGRLKVENDNYKKMFEDEEVVLALNEVRTGERHLWFNKAEKLEKTLTEIKDVLELYANSKIGEEQLGGTYKIVLGGNYITYYDPKPARQALQKISEVLNDQVS